VTRSFQLIIRRALVAAAVMAMTTCLSGCRRGDPRSAAEIKASIIDSMLMGIRPPGLRITVSAERYDSTAQEMHGVRVMGKQGVLYADRATITVDEETKSIRMKLFDVIVAQPSDEAESAPDGAPGHLVKYRELVLEDLTAPTGK